MAEFGLDEIAEPDQSEPEASASTSQILDELAAEIDA